MGSILSRIHPIITGTYGDGTMANFLAVNLATRLETTTYMSAESMEADIRNVCWSFFSGGSTAASVAKDIMKVLS